MSSGNPHLALVSMACARSSMERGMEAHSAHALVDTSQVEQQTDAVSRVVEWWEEEQATIHGISVLCATAGVGVSH
jgi:hypothetical protein